MAAQHTKQHSLRFDVVDDEAPNPDLPVLGRVRINIVVDMDGPTKLTSASKIMQHVRDTVEYAFTDTSLTERIVFEPGA